MNDIQTLLKATYRSQYGQEVYIEEMIDSPIQGAELMMPEGEGVMKEHL